MLEYPHASILLLNSKIVMYNLFAVFFFFNSFTLVVLCTLLQHVKCFSDVQILFQPGINLGKTIEDIVQV